jgi:DNA polymerase I-like protein with 3'-5' exonuclease and polymerase domains
MTKRALILIREEIQRSWQDKVKLVMTVHDQIDTVCIKDCSIAWASKMTELMEKAAKEILPSGLLKAETNITKCWEK